VYTDSLFCVFIMRFHGEINYIIYCVIFNHCKESECSLRILYVWFDVLNTCTEPVVVDLTHRLDQLRRFREQLNADQAQEADKADEKFEAMKELLVTENGLLRQFIYRLAALIFNCICLCLSVTVYCVTPVWRINFIIVYLSEITVNVPLTMMAVIRSVRLSVCLSPTSTLDLHSPEGAAVSHDVTVSCCARIVSTHRGDTLV